MKIQEFRVGQKVKLLVHGAGVTTEETTIIASVSKNAVTDEDGRFYHPETGHSDMGFAGFWFEICPLTARECGPRGRSHVRE